MPMDATTTYVITCDNPACPGNELDPADRAGWLFVTAETYGLPSSSHVYCCADCVGVDAARAFVPPPPLGSE